MAVWCFTAPCLPAETTDLLTPADTDTAPVAEQEPTEAEARLEPSGSPEKHSDNPYRTIVARNAFRLREPLPPPPPPTNPPVAPEPVKIDVKLAGLAKIRGVPYAYLMIPDADHAGQFLYPTLTDNRENGQVLHRSGLEVREIDIKQGTVRVVNGGVEATLNFKEHGVKSVAIATPPKPGTITAPGRPGGIIRPGATINTVFPAGGGVLPTPTAATPSGSEPIVFSRNPNRASAGNVGAGNAGFGTGGNVLTPGLGNTVPNPSVNLGGNLPNRPVRTDTTMAVPHIPTETQYQVLLQQREAAQSVGIRLPPIPGMPAEVPQAPMP